MKLSLDNSNRSFLGSLSLTTWLILINVVLFIAVRILFLFDFFPVGFVERFIALDPFFILRGKYLWTFITSMFMHANFLHLFVNMLSLFFIGSLIEKLIGRKRYFLFYILSGIFAGLFFVLFYLIAGNLDLSVPAVGASGALFGLIGVLVLLTPNLPVMIFFIPIPIKLKYAAPAILILLWVISIAGNVPIGNTAHLGGLIAGLAYGIYLRKKFKKKTSYMRKYFV